MTRSPEFAIGRMNPRHLKMLDFSLQGMTSGQIAKELKMDRSHVSNILNGPTFQHELAIRRSSIEDQMDTQIANTTNEVDDTLRNGALAAAEKLVGGLRSSDENIVYKSAESVLDRTGHPKIMRQEGGSSQNIVILTKDATQLLAETAAALQKEKPPERQTVSSESPASQLAT